MNLMVAYYVRINGPGSLEIAYHDPRARDRIVQETERGTGARFRFASAIPLAVLEAKGLVGRRTSADWTRRCALRGAVRAFGI